MKILYFVSLIFSLSVAADHGDEKYDPLVVRHVDGLIEAMHAKYSKLVDEEFQKRMQFGNLSNSDEMQVKNQIKSKFNHQVLKPFRKNALEIVSSAIKL